MDTTSTMTEDILITQTEEGSERLGDFLKRKKKEKKNVKKSEQTRGRSCDKEREEKENAKRERGQDDWEQGKGLVVD